MRLAKPEEVLAAMGVTQSVSALANAGQALDLSFSVMEKVLDTELSKASVVDYFDYAGPETTVRYQTYVLRLTRGFVDPYSVTVRYTSDGAPITPANPGTELPSSSYRLDANLGTVSFVLPLARGYSNVAVSYDAGFAEGDDIPGTLKSIAISAAVLQLNTLPSTSANREKLQQVNIARSVWGFLHTQAAPLERPRMAVEFPSSSEVE